MNVVLWILQALLALVFLAHGLMMLMPPPEVAAQMNEMLPRWFSLFLGVAEVAAGIGLVVPGVTRIKPVLVPAAALGVVIVMIGATILHVVRNEMSPAAITTVLLVMAIVVAHGRLRLVPIRPKA
ncbi:MAG: DoxX family protein [Acidobacteria bacterium]|nr:DoxX family protein [Acidobacteriota bacterium]